MFVELPCIINKLATEAIKFHQEFQNKFSYLLILMIKLQIGKLINYNNIFKILSDRWRKQY